MQPVSPNRLDLIKSCESADIAGVHAFFDAPTLRNSAFYSEPLYACAENNFSTGLQYIIDHGISDATTLSIALHTAIDFEHSACVDILANTYRKRGIPFPEKSFVMACQKDRPDLIGPLLQTPPPPEYFQTWPTKYPKELQTLLQYMAISQRKRLGETVSLGTHSAPVKRL